MKTNTDMAPSMHPANRGSLRSILLLLIVTILTAGLATGTVTILLIP